MEALYSDLERIFSKASEIYDRKIQANFINRMIRSFELTALLKFSEDADSFLEVGCGTGEESKALIQRIGRDIRLTAIDISSEMIHVASRKIGENCPGSNFDGIVMKAADIQGLHETFDVVYSFNGPLNTEPLLDSFFNGLLKITKKGSYFIVSLRNKTCIGEKLIYTLFRRSGRIDERKSDKPRVQVVGESVEVRNFNPGEFTGLIPKQFELREMSALGLFFPPYLAEKIRNPVMRKAILSLERRLKGLPLIRAYGDQTLYVFKRVS